MKFDNKVVIVTGASSGIGLACAKAFIAKNSKVVMAARSEDTLKKLSHEFECQGGKCIYIKTDVTIEEDCKRLVDETIKKYGRIDILINNAGISMRALLKDVKIEVLKKVMDVNFWGTVYCTKFALPYIQESKGTIVGISSIAGFHGLPGRTAYSASKAAMQGFLESVRIENLKKGVQVLILSAGFTSSNIRMNALDADGNPQIETPLPEERLTSPDRVARNVLRSIRKRKRNRIMTAEGQLMIFFQRIIPVLVDNTIYRKFKNEPNSPLQE
ncbi:MAG: SDR family oxidoreductase [Bacteroidales bacterium]|nr:SDR family oxidoreductase [Bacteroidales bacterium]MBN2817858.1 SDR family oxidoreductase [Bacteroidales bacterium]